MKQVDARESLKKLFASYEKRKETIKEKFYADLEKLIKTSVKKLKNFDITYIEITQSTWCIDGTPVPMISRTNGKHVEAVPLTLFASYFKWHFGVNNINERMLFRDRVPETCTTREVQLWVTIVEIISYLSDTQDGFETTIVFKKKNKTVTKRKRTRKSSNATTKKTQITY